MRIRSAVRAAGMGRFWFMGRERGFVVDVRRELEFRMRGDNGIERFTVIGFALRIRSARRVAGMGRL